MNLSYRQEKIQEKRKQTPRRDFVMTLGSRVPLVLYKHESIISKYPPSTGRVGNIISPLEYEKMREIFVQSNHDIIGHINFFHNFQKLYLSLPLSERFYIGDNENSNYAEDVFGAKNVYLSFGVGSASENVFYSALVKDYCTNVFNSVQTIKHSQNIYMGSGITNSYYIFYSKFITDSSQIWFSTNLIGCSECIFCDNLQNQSYCIQNKQYTKDDYLKQKTKLLQEKKKYYDWHGMLSTKGLNFASTNVDGGFIVKSTDIENGFYVYATSQGRNLVMVGGDEGNSDIYDVFLGGTIQADNAYCCTMFGVNSSHLYCSWHIVRSSYIYYCISLDSCSFCLGCIGLKNKSFCIFNKQYTKEERYTKVDEIFAQMEKNGTLGQFFPASMNPFYFNDTAAYLIDPSFTKEEVTAKGYLRRDEPIKVDIPADAQVVKSNDLDQFEKFDEQGNRMINADILKYVIQDEQGNYYRIIPMEYKFLMKHGLPLPRKHWLERMKENFKIN